MSTVLRRMYEVIDGSPLATFVAAARVSRGGLIDRYVVGRSPAVRFDLSV